MKFRSRVFSKLSIHYLRITKYILRRMGYRVVPTGLGYFDAAAVIEEAKKRGLSICEYLEESNLGSVGSRRDLVVGLIEQCHLQSNVDSILEIGSGTCMFLEKLIKSDKPVSVDMYEPDIPWLSYGKQAISSLGIKVNAWPSDGRSLDRTASQSIDKVYAHGVFVYTTALRTCGYFMEASRVLKSGGLFIFDVFIAEKAICEVIERFRLSSPDGYDFPVFMHSNWITSAAHSCGFEIINRFDTPYHGINTTYFILQKK